MTNTRKAGMIVKLALAATVVASGLFATITASQAGWMLIPGHGYVYCNYSYGYADCR
jgi:hypothetical protein